MATMADLYIIARPGVLPGIPPGMDKEAEQMWNELTRMAKEDPEKYDEFVSGQMKDARKAAKKQEREKPKPAICVESWGEAEGEQQPARRGLRADIVAGQRGAAAGGLDLRVGQSPAAVVHEGRLGANSAPRSGRAAWRQRQNHLVASSLPPRSDREGAAGSGF